MGLNEDIVPYIDRHGLVSPNGDTSGNGLLYTSEYLILLSLLGQSYSGPTTKMVASMLDCMDELNPGLFSRSPSNKDRESFDDLFGVCALGSLRQIYVMSKSVLNYARENRWCFNNIEPGHWNWASWLGRRWDFVAHVYFCAGRRPFFLWGLSWCNTVAFAGFWNRRNQDARMLGALMIIGAQKKGPLMRLASWIYKKRLKHDYPNGLGQVFAEYFNNPNHPLAKYWPGEF